MCSYLSDILGIEWQRLDLRARTKYRELSLGSDLLSSLLPVQYDSIATVGEIQVWWRADFQSGSRVLKKVF